MVICTLLANTATSDHPFYSSWLTNKKLRKSSENFSPIFMDLLTKIEHQLEIWFSFLKKREYICCIGIFVKLPSTIYVFTYEKEVISNCVAEIQILAWGSVMVGFSLLANSLKYNKENTKKSIFTKCFKKWHKIFENLQFKYWWHRYIA